jgi:hypothetical protein
MILSATVLLGLVLAACSSPAAPQASGGNGGGGGANSGQNGAGGPAITADMPVESKLAVGLLKLEGTSLSVTPAQAKLMLPLWQQIQSEAAAYTPSPNATPPAAAMQSTYQEIEKTLTADQIKSIQTMSLTRAELTDLMTVLEITPSAGGFGGGNPEQRATFIARATQNPNGGGGNAGTNGGTRTPRNGTPGPNGGRGRGGFGMNNLFIQPLIKMLQTRATS